MEIAIPLIALGGMYIISNQKKEHSDKKSISKENYVNMGIRSNLATKTSQQYGNYLPNTDIPPQNYPVSNQAEVIDTIQQYPNPNVATDKYFNQNLFEKTARQGGASIGQNIQDIYSMTGDYLKSDEFKHTNMLPFNGGKVKGRTYDMNIAESVLDNMNGSGSQIIKKSEQAPLFKPEDNIQWAYGMPNQSDFFQSRVNPGIKNNNVKPFEPVMVGPGLNKGYSNDGSGGFNSGMEARDKWLPKNVDELRVDTNPKLEYELSGHEGPADSFIKNALSAQMHGRVEKQRPDTYFVNGEDRWLKTTGASKRETLRSIQEMGVIKRTDLQSNYTGPAGAVDINAGYAPENYEPSKRLEVFGGGVGPSKATGKGPSTDKDGFLKSHTNYANNRSTVKQPDNIRSGFGGAIGAVIAPIMDIFKPTRKDETMHNIRIYGEAGTTVSKGYVYNPQESTSTTIKETNLHAIDFNINNQKESIYVNNYVAPDGTQRDSTSTGYYNAPGGAATGYGDMNYEAAYSQHNNDIKSQTINGRTNVGGTQIFNQTMNINNLKSDTDRLDGRYNPAFSKTNSLPPSAETYGSVNAPQYYNESANANRINPDILSSLKSNPYVFSFNSVV